MKKVIAKKKAKLEPVVHRMTDPEAKECVAKINANMNNVRKLVLELYEREGWTAMGYQSWRECVTAEFKQGQSYLYRQLEAAQIEKIISPNGEKEIPESQLRPLTKLKDKPEKLLVAWKQAMDTAPKGKNTAAHVKKAVNSIIDQKNHNRALSKKEEAELDIKAERAERANNMEKFRQCWSEASGDQRKELAAWINEEQKDFPADAKSYAEVAIRQLERISADDPAKEEALAIVEDWIKQHRNGEGEE